MKTGKLLTVLGLCALLSGCGGEELANVDLIQVLGVDGPGPVTLTAVGDEGAQYQTRGEDVTQAQEGLKALGKKRLEVTHVGQVVLGRSADPVDTLWRQVVDRESGYGATVWRSQGDAGALLAEAEEPGQRLQTLEDSGGVDAPTVLEAMSDLSRTGRARIPVVAVADGELTVVGYEEVQGVWPDG